MKRLTRWISSYYSISQTEANGFVILILLLFLASVGVFWMRSAPAESLEVDRHILDSLLLVLEENINLDTPTYRPKFYQKPKQAAAAFPSNSQRKGRNSTYEPKPYIKKVIARFDINEADTAQLKQLKGIGSVFSKRILKYRKLLGGFVTSDQLSEVYGLKDSVLLQLDTLTYVTPDFKPVTININTSDINGLSKHPYIKKSVAKAIYNYRYQHGNFSELNELGNIQLLDSLTLTKITPYISF